MSSTPSRRTASALAEVANSTIIDVRASGLAPLGLGGRHKRRLDRVPGALLLVVTPLLVLMALAIRLDSRGPAIFRQTRVGRHGMHFSVYKLRTMVTDAEDIKRRLADNDVDGVLFKMRRTRA